MAAQRENSLGLNQTDWRARFLVACAIAREAGIFARGRFLDKGSFTIKFKGRQDFLTEVDGETERLIASRVAQCFPDDGFLGEEGGGVDGATGAPLWVVDPIDGTSNFARGVPHFCVSIACIFDRTIELGAIYNPMLDELFSAWRGGGAWLNGAAMRAADTSVMSEAAIEVGWNARYGKERFVDLVGRIVATGAAVARTGSGALGLAYVGAGRRDGYIETHINSWDCLAGNLLVAEAGGYVTDFLAGEGLTKGGPLLACAPKIKQALLTAAAIEGLVL
jgi:myo-inositol-1(or 4)-monophosphatase